jgi:hypothetical protein
MRITSLNDCYCPTCFNYVKGVNSVSETAICLACHDFDKYEPKDIEQSCNNCVDAHTDCVAVHPVCCNPEGTRDSWRDARYTNTDPKSRIYDTVTGLCVETSPECSTDKCLDTGVKELKSILDKEVIKLLSKPINESEKKEVIELLQDTLSDLYPIKCKTCPHECDGSDMSVEDCTRDSTMSSDPIPDRCRTCYDRMAGRCDCSDSTVAACDAYIASLEVDARKLRDTPKSDTSVPYQEVPYRCETCTKRGDGCARSDQEVEECDQRARVQVYSLTQEPSHYPTLSEAGKEQAQRLIDDFKVAMTKAANEALSSLYTDIVPHIESDACNYRNSMIAAFQGYQEDRHEHDFRKIRAKLLEEHRDEIIKDLNQDLVKKIEELESIIRDMNK